MPERFDMVVIGSGPAGEKAAAQAAYFGKRMAIVEGSGAPGGSAVRRAEIPSKALRESALYITGFRRRGVYGLSLQGDPRIDLERLMARTSDVIATIVEEVRRNIARRCLALIRGRASLGPRRTVLVAGKTERCA